MLGKVRLALVLGLFLLLVQPVLAAEELDPYERLELRNIGPYNMSGRVADVEGIAGDPRTVWVGAASGGVWKSTDGGLTFEPVFDEQPIASIGDLGVSPSNPDVVYVGSGEANTRNSVSFGNGVYKTTDGGVTWTHLGLDETRHISRVEVHPTDPDTVWVAALGSIFAPNEERGVYKTTDGGETWRKVLYLDDRHGAADLDLDPTNPNVLFAGLWHFDRKPWTHTSGSEEGGVWKSVDGGETWEKIEEGLPKLMGRIGVKIAPSDPDTVYVIAETLEGTLYRSGDRGATFTKVTDNPAIVSRGLYYTDMRVDPTDADRVYFVSSRLFASDDGGKTVRRIAPSVHIDFHSLWIDPTDPTRLWVGQDGGVAVSYDRAETWEPIRNLPLAQFYQIYADDREPFYYLGGGLQDNGAWYGPSRTRELFGILDDDWRMMSFGDAYFIVEHPDDPEIFLSEYQGGGIMKTDMKTRQQRDISPQPRRNDGGPVGDLPYRFSWNAPIVRSPHDPMTVYFAGNVVFESNDFGESWRKISPDLTTDDPDKQGEAGGPVWYENTTAEYHCTIISFAESPVTKGLFYSGSDDGKLYVSRDGGDTWDDITANVPGVPEASAVSHVEPSAVDENVVYAAFDRHMFDDFQPHIYRSADGGTSWTRIVSGIPSNAWVWVVKEDPTDPNILWAGTELGVYMSRDRGGSWEQMHLGNFPTVAVHDLIVHPRENDLILGTHGRALWIFDDATPVQQLDDAVRAAPAHLFPVRDAMRFASTFTRYGLGDKEVVSPNPPSGALITYWLAESLAPEPGGEDETEPSEAAEESSPDEATESADADAMTEPEPRLTLEILDTDGEVIRELDDLPLDAGLNRVAWDLAHEPAQPRKEGGGGGGFFGFAPRGPMVLPGTYRARLTVDGEIHEQPIAVTVDDAIGASTSDLTAQFEMASRLTAMQTAVNDALRAIDAVRQQLDARVATAALLDREENGALAKALKGHQEAIDEVYLSLEKEDGKSYWSQGPRLTHRVGDLFGNVDNAFAAPTAAQRSYFDELVAETDERLATVNGLLDETVGAINATLDESGQAPIVAPAPIEVGD